MALAIDASSPAVASVTVTATATRTVTSASFTAPSGALLVAFWSGDSVPGTIPTQPTISDTGGLTWTLRQWQSRADAATRDGHAAVWTAVTASSAARTVSVVNATGASSNNGSSLQVRVFTDTGTPGVGASGKSGSASAAAIAQGFTATATGSWGLIADCDWDALAAQTAGTGCTLISSPLIASEITSGFVRRTTADGVSGNTTTLNVTLPGTSTNLNWVYLEVTPNAGASSARAGAGVASIPVAHRQPQRSAPAAIVALSRAVTPLVASSNPARPFVVAPGASPAVAAQSPMVRRTADPVAADAVRTPIIVPVPAAPPSAAPSFSVSSDPSAESPAAPILDIETAPPVSPKIAPAAVVLRSTADSIADTPPPPVVVTSMTAATRLISGWLTRTTVDPTVGVDTPTPVSVSRPAFGSSLAAPAPVLLVARDVTPLQPSSNPAAPMVVRVAQASAPASLSLLTRATADPAPVTDTPTAPVVARALPSPQVSAQPLVVVSRDVTALQASSNPAAPIVGSALFAPTAALAITARSTADPAPTDAPQRITVAAVPQPAQQVAPRAVLAASEVDTAPSVAPLPPVVAPVGQTGPLLAPRPTVLAAEVPVDVLPQLMLVARAFALAVPASASVLARSTSDPQPAPPRPIALAVLVARVVTVAGWLGRTAFDPVTPPLIRVGRITAGATRGPGVDAGSTTGAAVTAFTRQPAAVDAGATASPNLTAGTRRSPTIEGS